MWLRKMSLALFHSCLFSPISVLILCCLLQKFIANCIVVLNSVISKCLKLSDSLHYCYRFYFISFYHTGIIQIVFSSSSANCILPILLFLFCFHPWSHERQQDEVVLLRQKGRTWNSHPFAPLTPDSHFLLDLLNFPCSIV